MASYFAVINIGSYDTSLTVAEYLQNQTRILERVSVTLALGSDTYRSGKISAEKTARLLEIIQQYVLKLKEYPPAKLSVIATSALYEADNRYLVCEQIEQRFGLPVELLNKNQEMAFNHLAVRVGDTDFAKYAQAGLLILEVGYGSVQLSLFTAGELCFSQNLRLGSLRLTERLTEVAKYTADYAGLIKEYVSGDLQHFQSFAPKGTTIKYLMVTGASVSSWLKLHGNPSTPLRLSMEHCRELESNLLREQQYSSLLLPTVTLIEQALEFTELKEAILPQTSLADGVIAQLIEVGDRQVLAQETQAEALACAKRIAARYRTDKKHVNKVVKLALSFFDQTQKLHNLTRHDRLLLEISCTLHNVGKYFSMHDDKDISYTLLKTLELSGLDDEDLRTIALLVRLHRGNFYTDELYRKLEPKQQVRITKLLAVLVLANALDASHSKKVKDLKVKLSKQKLILTVTTNQNVALEMNVVNREVNLFSDLYGLKTIVKQERIL